MRKYHLHDVDDKEIEGLVRDEDGTYLYLPTKAERKRLMKRIGMSASEYREIYGRKKTAQQYQDEYDLHPESQYNRYSAMGATHIRRPRRVGDEGYGL